MQRLGPLGCPKTTSAKLEPKTRLAPNSKNFFPFYRCLYFKHCHFVFHSPTHHIGAIRVRRFRYLLLRFHICGSILRFRTLERWKWHRRPRLSTSTPKTLLLLLHLLLFHRKIRNRIAPRPSCGSGRRFPRCCKT